MKKAAITAAGLIVIAGAIATSIFSKGLTSALLQNYLVNFGFTLLKVATFGIASWFAFRVVDRFSRIDIFEQLRDREIGAWLFWAALTLALAYIIGQL